MDPTCGNEEAEYKFQFILSSMVYKGSLLYIIFPINEFSSINPTNVIIEGSINFYKSFKIE